MPAVKVKGKEKPVRMYAVINMHNVPGPKTLAEVRTLLGIPTPDMSKVNQYAEEKKFKFSDN
jgi:adenylate cyclase